MLPTFETPGRQTLNIAVGWSISKWGSAAVWSWSINHFSVGATFYAICRHIFNHGNHHVKIDKYPKLGHPKLSCEKGHFFTKRIKIHWSRSGNMQTANVTNSIILYLHYFCRNEERDEKYSFVYVNCRCEMITECDAENSVVSITLTLVAGFWVIVMKSCVPMCVCVHLFDDLNTE